MRIKLYNLFTNKQPGIAARYHHMHDNSRGIVKILSWVYLLWLNFAFYVLQLKFLGKVPGLDIYEGKRLNHKSSESEEYKTNHPYSVEDYVEKLSKYDVISFDIFDTLIFRPLSLPTDVFYMLGDRLGIMDMKNIRINAECEARGKRYDKEGDGEINLADIWDRLQQEVGVSSSLGQELEIELETNLCYANPFMKEVWDRLLALGKKVIIVSDMYLPKEAIAAILDKNGYIGYDRLYVSNEYHKSKWDGSLFDQVIEDLFGQQVDIKKDNIKDSIIHVGDNPHSDWDMAVKHGLSSMPYQNVNKNAVLYRAFDMSPIIGSSYRAIVSNHIYSGLNTYSMEYEYGYIYGGIFVLGYCQFIHDYCKKNGVEKILFLSRDGDIIKQVYDYIYPEDSTEYVYLSRKAATKMEAYYDKHDYFRRFIYHKVNQDYTIREILETMELAPIIAELETAANESVKLEDKLTEKNARKVRKLIEAKWDMVLKAYSLQYEAMKKYYSSILGGSKKAVAVDIGWAGSGAMTLAHLVSFEWELSCQVTGIIAGTNTVHNAEPDAAESFLQSGKLVSYLYSQAHNRDLIKRHDPNKDYNVFWELLLSSPTPQFKGFYTGDINDKGQDDLYLPELDITLAFGKYDKNLEGIRDIQRGVLDFSKQYFDHFRNYPYMMNISGRDAYAPMLLASSHNEKYLKAIEKKFALEKNIN